MIAITVDEQVVFVRQFRHGFGGVVLEIPGGVMELGKKPAESAARELQEETGYVAENIEVFPPLLPNPALNTARYHVALATGCALTALTNLDPFEQIEVELRPLDSVEELIRTRQLQHSLCVAAFSITGIHLK